MTSTTAEPAMKYSVQYSRDCMYLAGMFDGGLPTQVVKVGTQYRVRISKTSSEAAVPLVIKSKLGAGSLFQTARGTRWSIEGQKDVRKLIEMIEPYSVVRRDEIRLLRRIIDQEEGDVPVDELVEEWEKLRNAGKMV